MNSKIVIRFLVICAFFNNSFAQAQSKIDGTYYNPSGYVLEITTDSTLILLDPNSRIIKDKRLAVAKIRRVSEDFIELNSVVDAESRLYFSTRETKTYDPALIDNTINIKFRLPNVISEKFFIRVYTDGVISGKKTHTLVYDDKHQTIYIPERIKTFQFDLNPYDSKNSGLYGIYHGIRVFSPFTEFTFENKENTIEINISALDDAFFYRYYFKGDYAKIIEDGVVLKGVTYKKRK